MFTSRTGNYIKLVCFEPLVCATAGGGAAVLLSLHQALMRLCPCVTAYQMKGTKFILAAAQQQQAIFWQGPEDASLPCWDYYSSTAAEDM